MTRTGGVLLIVLGACLVFPQLFRTDPVQVLVAFGVLVAIGGGVMVCDDGLEDG
jgi:hypothetical protein